MDNYGSSINICFCNAQIGLAVFDNVTYVNWPT